ncbi:MAG: phage tail tube protein [Acetobacteraceae bacterium]
MAAVSGKNLRISKGDGASPEVFSVIGGARTDSLTLNNGTIDITNKDTNDFRRLLADAGVRSMDLSVTGIFTDTASENAIITAADERSIDNYKIELTGVGIWQGAFIISSFQINGSHDGVVEYSASFQSSGDFTFTAS